MQPTSCPSRARLFSTIGLILITIIALASSTLPARSAPSTGGASSRLSSTLQRFAQDAQQARAMAGGADLAGGLRSNLLIKPDGAILVQVRVAKLGPATEQTLEAAGLSVHAVSAEFAQISGFIAPERLNDLAAVPEVISVSETYQPMLMGGAEALGGQSLNAAPRADLAGLCDLPNIGTATTEGVAHLRADLAQALTLSGGGTLNGSGVKVGIISDSFDAAYRIPSPTVVTSATTDILNGDLPGPINPCGRTEPMTLVREIPQALIDAGYRPLDEARAMAQIVHDMAPGAQIFVASGLGVDNAITLASVIRTMQSLGIDIIVDDVGFQDQAVFQDDVASVAVDEVVAKGVIYFTAAGNFNRTIDKSGKTKDVTSYTALAYRPMPCPALTFQGQPFALTGDCHDFNPGVSASDATAGFSLAAGQGLYTRMQWADPWFGVTTDFDFYWVNDSNEIVPNPFDPTVPAGSYTNNLTSNKPLEGDTPIANQMGTSQNLYLVINRKAGTGTPALWVWLNAGNGVITDAEYLQPDNPSTSPDIFGQSSFGHRSARGALSIGAVPYTSTTTLEAYSTRGGPLLYFAPIVSGTVSAALPRPILRQKPDLVATDGGANSFFGRAPNAPGNPTAFWRFYGTSAATPHAAGAAAIVLQQARASGITLNAARMGYLLRSTARPVGSLTARAVGAGLIDTYAATLAVRPSTPVTIVAPTTAAPAIAGTPIRPGPITVQVRAPRGLAPGNFSVKVGTKAATILAAVGISNTYMLEVLPPTQDKIGLYDLSVGMVLSPTTGLATTTITEAVKYGVIATNRGFRLRTYLNQRSYNPGQPIHIQAVLLNSTGVTTTTTISATVLGPASTQSITDTVLPLTFELKDDGLSGDGAAGDGVFGGTYAGMVSESFGASQPQIQVSATFDDGFVSGVLHTSTVPSLTSEATVTEPDEGTAINVDDRRTYLPIIYTLAPAN